MADRSHKKPFVLLTFVFFVPLTLMFCNSFWPLAAAFVARGPQGVRRAHSAALILDLSPPEMRATMFGCYYFGATPSWPLSFAAAFSGKNPPELNLAAAWCRWACWEHPFALRRDGTVGAGRNSRA